jgi:hypothetical protein
MNSEQLFVRGMTYSSPFLTATCVVVPVQFSTDRRLFLSTGKYVGSRPIKLRKSMWKDRNMEVVRKKQKEKKKLGLR